MMSVSTVIMKSYQWCRGVVVQLADSQHRGCQFESCTCHNKNATGEEGKRKPSHEFHFPGKKLRVLSLISANLEIGYATQLREVLTVPAWCNPRVHERVGLRLKNSPGKTCVVGKILSVSRKGSFMHVEICS